MEKHFLCPRTEICFIYTLYVDNTGDDTLGIIDVESIENRDYYSCKALSTVMKLKSGGKLSPETTKRLQGLFECLLINQANKTVEKHRPDS